MNIIEYNQYIDYSIDTQLFTSKCTQRTSSSEEDHERDELDTTKNDFWKNHTYDPTQDVGACYCIAMALEGV